MTIKYKETQLTPAVAESVKRSPKTTYYEVFPLIGCALQVDDEVYAMCAFYNTSCNKVKCSASIYLRKTPKNLATLVTYRMNAKPLSRVEEQSRGLAKELLKVKHDLRWNNLKGI